jgi:hypothetical protein
MTIVIGISVHDDEVKFSPKEDKVLFVFILSGLAAEYTPSRFLAEDIIDPPGRP